MRVLFLINDAFGIGGTIKTTFNLGAALAARGHDVEVLSTVRPRDVPHLRADPAIRLMSLIETRAGHPDHEPDGRGRGEPARVYPRSDVRAAGYDRFVERRYRAFLRRSDADVVIATRPGLIAYTAAFAPRRMVRIGQEHLTRGAHRKALRQLMPKHIGKLDAFVTVSERDAADYRAHLSLRRTRLLHIPNGVPEPGVPPSHGRAKLVVAAGRLIPSKRYDVLVRAFAKVVAERPDWTLRVYGLGKETAVLRELVLELGLHNHVRLMGPVTPIEPEWAKAAIAAVSADKESFGITLVEAMRSGVPVVSTDARWGPGEILRDGEDGLLTPVGDPDALGDALLRVINDDELRRSMAAAALANSARYDPAPIAERYEELFHELARGKRRWRRPRPMTVLGPAPSVTDPVLDWDGVAPLPEGVSWQPDGPGVFRLVRDDGTPVQAGRRDTRALLDGPVGARIQLPFRGPDGVLGMRVWDREVYAEVGDVDADSEGVHVAGRLFGAHFEDASLEARDGEQIMPLRIVTDGAGFRGSVGALPPGMWELWLRPAAGAEPVRLGRFRDDIVDKRAAFVLPSVRIDGVALQPAYTASNEFSIRART
ncbi:glycosyltransferase family 4 protein [Actinoplanes sp. TBRC 11911]|uniref:glycosyltransferase n=1 Tax=Actinoplanes sp. TBRC 11911 TaxID=2729386 RepID=UPI00145CFCBE|nr:glycosyltransferase [Actinoplanes sp. TBRC 11911]NMO57089.1 glycosyltransferase family 4 protein [Actinoplanes sp. TBRC 11911]